MKIQFTEQQYDFLKSNLNKENMPFLIFLENHKLDKNLFELDEDFMEELREWSIDTQIKSGFDEKYQLNEKGVILNTLIDLLFL